MVRTCGSDSMVLQLQRGRERRIVDDVVFRIGRVTVTNRGQRGSGTK